MQGTLEKTEYNFPGQTAVYHGKVRDVYTIKNKYLAVVATDRISAFDQVLPRQIPYKGQVLNQIAAYFLKATEAIASNWLISVPDENASLGYKCKPFKVELVVRAVLVGHAWREYQAGKRELCGQHLAEGLRKYDLFKSPIITPTTKAEAGHDEDITHEQVVSRGLASQKQFDEMCEIALKLFEKGQKMAKKKGLILADTKYEFGQLNGHIVLMDEIHTPDSSRYFYLKSFTNREKEPPRHLSKEFVREWLIENGFSGQPGESIPEMTDDMVQAISERYIELYEQITGQTFKKAENVDIERRIWDNIEKAIGGLS